MKMNGDKWLRVAMVAVAVLLGSSWTIVPAASRENYVTLQLPQNVTIELPRNWKALSQNSLTTLQSAVQAMGERLTGGSHSAADLNFAANLYDDSGRTAAMFNIRYYPDMDLGQEDAEAATEAEVEELDLTLRQEMKKAMNVLGDVVSKWHGTEKQVLSGKTVFITDYIRTSTSRGSAFRVRLMRVFNFERSFTATISYRVDLEPLLKPICDKSIRSLKF